MRIFGGEQIKGLMDRLNIPEDTPIENKLVSRAIEQAQVKVEGFNFDMRKSLVEYDDVANQQREIVYGLRRRILDSSNLKDEILEKLEHQIERVLMLAKPETGELDDEKIIVGMLDMVPFDDVSRERVKQELKKLKSEEDTKTFLVKVLNDVHSSREKQMGDGIMRQIEKFAYLSSIDHLWINHIDYIDGLREGVRLRAYGQRDPLVEFKNEAYGTFETLIDRIDEELAHRIYRIGVAQTPRPEIPLEQARTNVDRVDAMGLAQGNSDLTSIKNKSSAIPNSPKKVGRNDPCPCGSGKKYKKCHYPQYG